jgi:hypothetical protein
MEKAAQNHQKRVRARGQTDRDRQKDQRHATTTIGKTTTQKKCFF